MLSPFIRRFRTVVAMWIFVGFAGAPLAFVFALMLFTGTGLFKDLSAFEIQAEFAPGEEVATSVAGMGDFLVVAHPRTVDLADVECTAKSRVYSTGTQHVETVLADHPDGVEPVLRSREAAPREFAAIAIVDWMGIDYISCTGGGAESFALASGDGVYTDGFRYSTGAICLVMSVAAGLGGCLALHFTRKWGRESAQAQYGYGQGWGRYGQPPYGAQSGQYGQPPYDAQSGQHDQPPHGQQPWGQQPYPPQGPTPQDQQPQGQQPYPQPPHLPQPPTSGAHDPYTPPAPR